MKVKYKFKSEKMRMAIRDDCIPGSFLYFAGMTQSQAESVYFHSWQKYMEAGRFYRVHDNGVGYRDNVDVVYICSTVPGRETPFYLPIECFRVEKDKIPTL